MAAAEPKPLCKFGENCYRKNPQHLKQFRHPKRKQTEDDSEGTSLKKKKVEGKAKGKNIEDFFGKKEARSHEISDEEEDKGSNFSHEGKEESPQKDAESEPKSDEEEEEEEEIEDTPPTSPVEDKENIKQKFLVDMPEDFYEFWEFCKSEKSDQPTDALLKLLDLQLIGPYDILAGKHKGVTKNRHGKRPNFLLHWRYYYDPPEFQTVIKGDDQTQFHIGYFRDDPQELPVFVAVNSAKTSCKIEPKGDNLFAAVSSPELLGSQDELIGWMAMIRRPSVMIALYHQEAYLIAPSASTATKQICLYIDEKLKSKDTASSKKEKLKELSGRLQAWAAKHSYSLELKTKRMKERDKKVVCKSFHGAGIVVPVDENEVGYREVPETPADLKRMFKKIADSKTEGERDKNYEPLQELITLVQFANDECDYGEGLELGMDLFCYGGSVFHSTISQLMPLAYMLLRKPEFEKIIEAHLKRRSHDSNLSQLE